MANPKIKINGWTIQRTSIIGWQKSGTTSIAVKLIDGSTEVKDMGSSSKADEALAMLDNITEVDDIDGL